MGGEGCEGGRGGGGATVNPHPEHRFPVPSSKEGCRKPLFGICGQSSTGVKLQALVYDILPWRKVPESDARSVQQGLKTRHAPHVNLCEEGIMLRPKDRRTVTSL